MPLEPRLRPLVAIARRGATLVPRTPEEQRTASLLEFRRFGRLLLRPGRPVARTTDRFVDVQGGRIQVRLYYPRDVAAEHPRDVAAEHPRDPAAEHPRDQSGERPRDADRRLPLHVFLHGGGWVTGTLAERDNRCRDLAADVGCVVASVAYRLAPENAFPTPAEDCFAALKALVDEASELGIDPTRVSIGGESAGANLAAVVAVMARDRGGPSLVLQLLDVPATDLTMSLPSHQRNGTGFLLEHSSMEAYVAHYLGNTARASDPMASPLFTPDLSGLPPAAVTVAEYDPLHDEGRAYAERLREAGVAVEVTDLAGHVHPSFAFTRLLPSAAAYHRACVSRLVRAFGLGKGPRPER